MFTNTTHSEQKTWERNVEKSETLITTNSNIYIGLFVFVFGKQNIKKYVQFFNWWKALFLSALKLINHSCRRVSFIHINSLLYPGQRHRPGLDGRPGQISKIQTGLVDGLMACQAPARNQDRLAALFHTTV